MKGEEMKGDLNERILKACGVWVNDTLVVLVFLYIGDIVCDELENLRVRVFSGGRVLVNDKDLVVHQEISECLRKDGQELLYACFSNILNECRDNRFDNSFQILSDSFGSKIHPIAVP
jgi:hypothetical protein